MQNKPPLSSTQLATADTKEQTIAELVKQLQKRLNDDLVALEDNQEELERAKLLDNLTHYYEDRASWLNARIVRAKALLEKEPRMQDMLKHELTRGENQKDSNPRLYDPEKKAFISSDANAAPASSAPDQEASPTAKRPPSPGELNPFPSKGTPRSDQPAVTTLSVTPAGSTPPAPANPAAIQSDSSSVGIKSTPAASSAEADSAALAPVSDANVPAPEGPAAAPGPVNPAPAQPQAAAPPASNSSWFRWFTQGISSGTESLLQSIKNSVAPAPQPPAAPVADLIPPPPLPANVSIQPLGNFPNAQLKVTDISTPSKPGGALFQLNTKVDSVDEKRLQLTIMLAKLLQQDPNTQENLYIGSTNSQTVEDMLYIILTLEPNYGGKIHIKGATPDETAEKIQKVKQRLVSGVAKDFFEDLKNQALARLNPAPRP